VAVGEPLGAASAVALAVIAAGIAMAAMPSTRSSVHEPGRGWEAVPLALAAALAFGASLYATARAGDQLPAAWVVLSARLIGAVLLAAPLALFGRLRLTRQALPLVIVSGICEVAAFYSFIAGARHGIAVAAVLASQFAALAAVAAYFVFGERLARVQLAGVATLLVGVAVLTALRA
jgi:drug/metabolite transporter (DMT)-like permease